MKFLLSTSFLFSLSFSFFHFTNVGGSPAQSLPKMAVMERFGYLQCPSKISEQRRCKMNARNTCLCVFFDASKIAYPIRVCAFVIHNRNFAFPVIVYEDKSINCVTADKLKIYICMYVALITNQFPTRKCRR